MKYLGVGNIIIGQSLKNFVKIKHGFLAKAKNPCFMKPILQALL